MFDDADHAARLFGLQEFGNIYTRIMNPTTDVFEKRVAALEGGVGGLALASGQAAETLAMITLAKAGEEIVSTTSLYGGTYNLFHYTLPRLGIESRFVDGADYAGLRKAINDKTRAVYTETLGNPKLDVAEIEKLAGIAHEHGLPLIIDNTSASPGLVPAHRRGAPTSWSIRPPSSSAGHGTSLGGVIVDGGKFDWKASGRFPEFVEPDPSYHGICYTEAFGPLAYILKARVQGLRDTGACLSPFNAFLLLQGAETLHLRMQRHRKTRWPWPNSWRSIPQVAWVNYPGLQVQPVLTSWRRKYLPDGAGALVTFGIRGGYEAGEGLSTGSSCSACWPISETPSRW